MAPGLRKRASPQRRPNIIIISRNDLSVNIIWVKIQVFYVIYDFNGSYLWEIPSCNDTKKVVFYFYKKGDTKYGSAPAGQTFPFFRFT